MKNFEEHVQKKCQNLHMQNFTVEYKNVDYFGNSSLKIKMKKHFRHLLIQVFGFMSNLLLIMF